jgi:rhamnosyltransferase
MPLVGPKSRAKVDATVFIPTFNGEKYLERLLTAVESQDYAGNFEILIIDSGSTDRTLDFIAAHPSVRLVTISQSEFGHGKTRNQAAQLARGEFIIYLSHDAVPLGKSWLSALVSPLSEDGLDCQAVVGKHIARPDCFPSLKYGIESVFRGCGPDGEVTVVDGSKISYESLPPGQKFYSDVCSATRRSFLLTVIPYRDVNYSEDMYFAKDLILAGYKKAYQPAAVVEHSNDVTLREYPKRMFDETLGMRKVNEEPSHFSWLSAILRTVKEVLLSSRHILTDSEYSVAGKLRWLVVNAVAVCGKWIGIRRGRNVRVDDWDAIAKYSLEAERS